MMDSDQYERWVKDSMSWPQYYIVGEKESDEKFSPTYYKIDGPNGPIQYRNPSSGPYPATMHGFAMDAMSHKVEYCQKSDTPWS